MAYTTATLTRVEQNGSGSVSLIITFTGNAGELPIEQAYQKDLGDPATANDIRALAMARLNNLNNNRNFFANATAQIGSTLDVSTPLPTPTQIAFGEFMAAVTFTPGATPQDVFTLSGSATKTVRVTRVGLSSVQTTAGMNLWNLIKRSTANTGGTSAVVTAVPIASTYPAATAVVRSYTANPTLGTAVGTAWAGRIPSAAPATAASEGEKVLSNGRELFILNGVAESIAWNLGGIALPAGLSVTATIGWMES